MNIFKILITSATLLLFSFFAPLASASTSYFISSGGNFSASNYGGSTTYFSGDVTGTASNYGGNTTYYNIGGKSFTGSNYGGSAIYFSGDLSGTASNYGGSTTYYNLGGKNFTGSNYGGSTTYFSGDVTGTASNYGRDTTYYNTKDSSYSSPALPSYNTPVYSQPTTYHPSYPRYYNHPSIQTTTPTKVYTQNTTPAKTYGGGSEPTFQTQETYDLWKRSKDHPAETLSEGLDADSSENVALPDVISVMSLGGGNVRVSWKAVSGARRYHIFYGGSSGNYGYNTNLGNETSHDVGGLPVGSKYFFAIQAELVSDHPKSHGSVDYYSRKGKEGSILVK